MYEAVSHCAVAPDENPRVEIKQDPVVMISPQALDRDVENIKF